MKQAIIIFVLFIMTVLFPAIGEAAATYNLDTSGGDCATIGVWDTINESCTLSSDLSVSGSGIEITGNGVGLNGCGYSLIGDGSADSVGINSSGLTGISISDIAVRGFSIGIKLDQTTGSVVSGNEISDTNIAVASWDSTGNTISNNAVTENSRGIHLVRSDSTTVSANAVSSNTEKGIALYLSNDNLVTGNDLSNNDTGVRLDESNRNRIENNTFSSNRNGLDLSLSHNNTLINNQLFENSTAISLLISSYNDINGNTIENNVAGLSVDAAMYERDGYSHDNVIYANRFIDNDIQVSVYCWIKGCGWGGDPTNYENLLNQPLPVGGNYWSDWIGPDANNDGFVDYPYVTDGGTDYWPLSVQNNTSTPIGAAGSREGNDIESSTDGGFAFKVLPSTGFPFRNMLAFALILLAIAALLPKGKPWLPRADSQD